mgnify:FL=1|jgi:hypothetical protein
MKKILFLVVLAMSVASSAQNNKEIKIDIFDVLALKSLDISYEYIMNEESSVGISVLSNFEKKAASFRYSQKLVVTPYYRQHLFQRDNVNFFGELFGAVNTGDLDPEELGDPDSYTDFALGLGFGGKYLSENGFVVDFHAGIGRNLFNTDLSKEVVPRIGISVGKRF